MKQEMYVYIYDHDKGNKDRKYHLEQDPHDFEWMILLGKTTASFDLPPMPSDEELTNREIAFLQKGREEVTKEFATKLANIDRSIEELRALPAPPATDIGE